MLAVKIHPRTPGPSPRSPGCERDRPLSRYAEDARITRSRNNRPPIARISGWKDDSPIRIALAATSVAKRRRRSGENPASNHRVGRTSGQIRRTSFDQGRNACGCVADSPADERAIRVAAGGRRSDGAGSRTGDVRSGRWRAAVFLRCTKIRADSICGGPGPCVYPSWSGTFGSTFYAASARENSARPQAPAQATAARPERDRRPGKHLHGRGTVSRPPAPALQRGVFGAKANRGFAQGNSPRVERGYRPQRRINRLGVPGRTDAGLFCGLRPRGAAVPTVPRADRRLARRAARNTRLFEVSEACVAIAAFRAKHYDRYGGPDVAPGAPGAPSDSVASGHRITQ